MAMLIASFNTKGGCGKTSTLSSVGLYLAGRRNRKVVAIDLDNNGSLSFSLTGTSLETILDREEVQQKFAQDMLRPKTHYDQLKDELKSLESELRGIIQYATASLENEKIPDYPLNGPDDKPITRAEIVSLLSSEQLGSLRYRYECNGKVVEVNPNNLDMVLYVGEPPVIETNKREELELAKEELEKLLEKTLATTEFCKAVSDNVRLGRYPMKMFLGEEGGLLGRLRRLLPGRKSYGINYREVIQKIVQDDPNVVVLLDTDRYRESDGDVAPIWMVADLFDSIHIVVPSRDIDREQKSVQPYILDAVKRLGKKGVPKEKVRIHNVINFAETQNVFVDEWRELVLSDLIKLQAVSRKHAGGDEPIMGCPNMIGIPLGGGESYEAALLGIELSVDTLDQYEGSIQCEVVEVRTSRNDARKRADRYRNKITLPTLKLKGETYCPFLSPYFPIMDVNDHLKILPGERTSGSRKIDMLLAVAPAMAGLKTDDSVFLAYKNKNPFEGRDGVNLAYAHFFKSIETLCERMDF